MNILYDPQVLTMQKYGGISRYFYEIISRLSNKEDVNISIPAIFSINYYFREYHNPKSFFNSLPFKGKGMINRLNFKRYLSQKKNEIIHPTYYNPYIFKRKSGIVVSTIHDLTQEMNPELFKNDKTIFQQKEQTIRQSDMIIAISESTKKDILTYYPFVSAKKIVVIHHGNSLKKRESYTISEALNVPKHFILFTGSRAAYKNFTNFICAIESILRKNKEIMLVCTGGGDFLQDEADLFHKMNINRQIIHYNASDELLSYLYSKAICFVFPSLYEGFGLPILEAFDHQCPAVLSNTSSFPEIGGNAAVYFDPNDVNDMNRQIETVINDEKLRRDLVEIGNIQSAKFSWDKAAEETYQVYRSML